MAAYGSSWAGLHRPLAARDATDNEFLRGLRHGSAARFHRASVLPRSAVPGPCVAEAGRLALEGRRNVRNEGIIPDAGTGEPFVGWVQPTVNAVGPVGCTHPTITRTSPCEV